MYKVIIVDDEIWSLEGLAASFQWEENGFQVIGKYTDSLEAVCRIREESPDVVFTDIRMPDMTGLEMMKEIRKKDSDVEFIIVSGYGEFEYAREAVRQGAYDYNLKPIDLSEADIMLKKLKHDLDRKHYDRDELLLQHLLYENRDEDALRQLSECSRIQAVFLSVLEDVDECVLNEWLMPMVMACVSYRVFMPAWSKRLVFYEVKGQGWVKKWISDLELSCRKKGYIGFSSEGDLNQASILGKEAMLAASGQFIGKETGVTNYIQISNPYYEAYGKKITALILGNQYEETCRHLDEVVCLIRQEEVGIFFFVRLWNQIAILLHENLCYDKNIRIEFLDFYQMTRKFESLDEICQYIKIEIAEIMIGRGQQAEFQRNYNENFMELLGFVKDHYHEKLSLGMLADQFYLNMSYCSELFKKVTGMNFSDYLTKLRMEKAAYLLGEMGLPAKDVAELTGYSDAFYFSKVFKKYYGVNPSCFEKRS